MSLSEGKENGQDAADWSPDQYLRFSDARNRAIHELIGFLGPDYAPARIIDLGCGPGNSTALLAARFPGARITGVDSSPAMLARAREALPPHIDLVRADVRTYQPDADADLLFANAVFHWLPADRRIPTVARLLAALRPGAVLALQMPDNRDEPSHRCMRDAAAAPGPWRPFFFSGSPRPDLDPIEPPLAYYDALRPLCAGSRGVEMWTTRFVHALDGHADIVEWVRATGLRPFVNALPADGGVREAFVDEYRRRLEAAYPRAVDGRVLLEYPRRFVVAFR